jgi:hypothetical protein
MKRCQDCMEVSGFGCGHWRLYQFWASFDKSRSVSVLLCSVLEDFCECGYGSSSDNGGPVHGASLLLSETLRVDFVIEIFWLSQWNTRSGASDTSLRLRGLLLRNELAFEIKHLETVGELIEKQYGIEFQSVTW